MKMNIVSRLVRRLGAVVTASVLVYGCVSTTASSGANEPGSARAETAPAPSGASALSSEHHATPSSVDPAAHDHADQNHAGHDHAAQVQAGHEPGQEQGSMYTCPMHPEVRQGQPGRCPKCGMALEIEEAEEKTRE